MYCKADRKGKIRKVVENNSAFGSLSIWKNFEKEEKVETKGAKIERLTKERQKLSGKVRRNSRNKRQTQEKK